MALTLTYFDARGLAEPIRWILAYGGEKFEDVRAPLVIPPVIPLEIKKKCTWGQVPLLEFGDGIKLTQSAAITRYFAKKHNLVPKDDFEAALCDEYVDAARDFMKEWLPAFMEQDKAKRLEKAEEISKVMKPRFITVFNSLVEGNDGKHLVGNTLTWADIVLAFVISNVELVTGLSFLSEFPGLQNLSSNVLETKGIKEWIEKRPKTSY